MATESIWAGDLLGFDEVGNSFGNLVRSIDDSKVISIEAGYGRGKTFFRERWAKQLRVEDEVVVEVDALLSDHSGDPVLTFIAALVAALPEAEASSGEKLLKKSKQYGGVALRSVLRLGLRQGADEVIDMVTGEAIDALGDNNAALKEAVEEFGDGLSKMAGDLIAAQVLAERVRTKEIPEQLTAIRDALTDGKPNKRVVILVDELDRCHPDFAIAFLEAIKLVFGQDGFVFCLFVNAEYLESVATHRFGNLGQGESYLDKFVDFRLKLPVEKDALESAVYQIALAELHLSIPFGDGDLFSVEHAAKVASLLAVLQGLSTRKAKRMLERVGLVLRCYSDQPIDASLLVFLAFQTQAEIDSEDFTNAAKRVCPRALLTPACGEWIVQMGDLRMPFSELGKADRILKEEATELCSLPSERYGPDVLDGGKLTFLEVVKNLAPHYIPSHQAMLDAVQRFDVKAVEEA